MNSISTNKTNIYLMNIQDEKLLNPSDEELERLLSLIDPHRRSVAERMSKNPRGRAASIGAGLMMLYALRERGIRVSAENIRYRFGESGKPYFEDATWPYFNISHAGGYVALAVSGNELGIDIQDRRGKRETDMAERFFSEEEALQVSKDESRDLFYRLWARKEALGKCTGEGVRPYFSRNMLDILSNGNEKYTWFESEEARIFLTVCEIKNNLLTHEKGKCSPDCETGSSTPACEKCFCIERLSYEILTEIFEKL